MTQQHCLRLLELPLTVTVDSEQSGINHKRQFHFFLLGAGEGSRHDATLGARARAVAGTGNIPKMVGCQENIQDLFRGSKVSLLTREEVQKIFEDIESCLEDNNQDNRKKVTERRTKEESIEIESVNTNKKPLQRRSIKSKNKSFATKLRKGLIKILQKLINRKKTSYYRRMVEIKSQWVISIMLVTLEFCPFYLNIL